MIVEGKGFPGSSDSKASACIAEDLGSIPGLGRSPGEGTGNPLQYSRKCHECRSLVGYNPWDHRVVPDWATSLVEGKLKTDVSMTCLVIRTCCLIPMSNVKNSIYSAFWHLLVSAAPKRNLSTSMPPGPWIHMFYSHYLGIFLIAHYLYVSVYVMPLALSFLHFGWQNSNPVVFCMGRTAYLKYNRVRLWGWMDIKCVQFLLVGS